MKKYIISFFLCMLSCAVSAQLYMRDVFAQLPDSVFPLMTKNNRLDCIDFIENGMEARVKNLFDDQVVLDSLTEDFLSIRTSDGSYVEMKLFTEGEMNLICVNRTYLGPSADSEVKVYDTSWKYVRAVSRPKLELLLKKAEELQPWSTEMADTLRMVRAEAEVLPLMKAKLCSGSNKIVWTLQSSEYSKEIKKAVGKYLQPVILDL